MLTYLVSGDADIRPSDENIRRSGRRVRHGGEVDGDARVALTTGKHFVVVAHGNRKGTAVSWFRDDWKDARRWLYVGMQDPPAGARVYLYCCYAGIALPRYLKKSDVFGHVDVVPTPVGPSRDVVLAFFSQVEALFGEAEFDRERWRKTLGAYVNELYVKEVLSPSATWTAAVLLMLRKSLGFSDE